jgi:dihydrofolate synthase/folylpolyglutamate synthase
MIQSIVEAESYLSGFMGRTAQITGKDVTVQRMWELLKLVDNPQNKLKVVHIAGTSGKTSTAYYIASLLRQSGKKVGLTVSPHIRSIIERLQINGSPLSDREFCKLIDDFSKKLGDNVDATYFEILIAFVLWAFVELEVDYAVLETGLGGLHDATNVCRREDKVCVITDIGFDHQHILGNTLNEIAGQKIGIVHPGNVVFTYEQSNEIQNVFTEYTRNVGAVLNIANSNNLNIPLPKYQIRNWNLAFETYKFISNRDNLPEIGNDAIANTYINVPGRMHEQEYHGVKFVLDGAHNVQKMTAFVDSFKDKYPGIKVTAILSIKEDKDFQQVIEILSPILKKTYCVNFELRQDMPIRSVDPHKVHEICESLGIESEVVSSIKITINKIIEDKVDLAIVTGSLYILGSVLEIIENKKSI